MGALATKTAGILLSSSPHEVFGGALIQRCAGILASTKADFSDYSGLFELEANAGDGQNNQQIVGVI
ncbi:MAG: hypothetical protein ACI8XO_004852, partial [Verrucomicrobiales bacterium]